MWAQIGISDSRIGRRTTPAMCLNIPFLLTTLINSFESVQNRLSWGDLQSESQQAKYASLVLVFWVLPIQKTGHMCLDWRQIRILDPVRVWRTSDWMDWRAEIETQYKTTRILYIMANLVSSFKPAFPGMRRTGGREGDNLLERAGYEDLRENALLVRLVCESRGTALFLLTIQKQL